MGEITAIRAARLAKSYGDKVALRGVTFEVGYGEVFAYLGRNGSGKTTTVRILTGLSAPTAGTGGWRVSPWDGSTAPRSA
jgi:ABC-2 type transport system ATP-binding protein